MSFSRDLTSNGPVISRYAILSVPRSGSTLLARSLERTGQLGVPHEYLNPNAIAAWVSLGGDESSSLQDYLEVIEKRRTSSGGWFGIKVHFRHFEQHFGDDAQERALDFVNAQDHCILITRRDHVAQAVSYYRARLTGIWTSEHAVLASQVYPSRVPFDAQALESCLHEVQEGEKQWRRIIGASFTPVHEIAFEDLVNDYVEVMDGVLRFLNIRTKVWGLMPTRSVRAHPSDSILEEFRAHLAGLH